MGEGAAASPILDPAIAAQIGREVELSNDLQKNGVDPHPLVLALARAWNGAEHADNDGLFSGDDEGYTAMVARRRDHFTVVRFGRTDGSDLSPRTVLRLLRLSNRLSAGDPIPLDESMAGINESLDGEGFRLWVLPEVARASAFALAGVPGSWDDADARERVTAARAWAQAQGASPADVVVSSWSASVPRRKVFEFLENLPG